MIETIIDFNLKKPSLIEILLLTSKFKLENFIIVNGERNTIPLGVSVSFLRLPPKKRGVRVLHVKFYHASS